MGLMIRNRVRDIIQGRNITIYRFWRDTGVSRNTAYDLYHNPARYPMAEAMERICRAYKISPGEVIEWIPDDGESSTPS